MSCIFVDYNAVLLCFLLTHCFLGQLQGKMLEDENKLLAFKLVSDLQEWLTRITYC
jgi:hypothetical protein